MTDASDSAPSAVVREGDTIVFDINGERQALVTVDARSEVKLGKVFCSAKPIIGCPYGSMFGLAADGKSLERVEYVPSSDWDLPTPDVAPDFNTRTNADLLDAGHATQALSAADIEAMKAAGAGGEAIVAALTANSATFAAKTEFSQEKYKRKKSKKYIQVGTVRRPTAAAVCEAYFANNPSKSGYLRADCLALLLCLANVGAHARVLVVEGCGGLVTAAVAERLGGYGGVVSAWAGGPGTRKPALEIWRHMNLGARARAALRFAPLHELREERRRQREQQATAAAATAAGVATEVAAAAAAPAAAADSAAPAEQADAAEQPLEQAPAAPAEQLAAAEQGAQQVQQPPLQQHQQQAAEPAPMQVEPAAAAPAAPAPDPQQQQPQPQQRPAQSNKAAPAAAAAAAAPPFNSCILAAANLQPLALIRHALPLLAPSASLAVYCPWQAPLAEALDALRGQGEVAGLALHECWWREMQVLPLRTHPTMNMNHGGGFILSATALAPREQQQQRAG